MIESQISVSLDQFDGPLSLLLHLVQKDEMRLDQLDLKIITRRYLDYLSELKDLNFDVAGEYLYLASTLVWLKSGLGLDEDKRDELNQSSPLSEALQSEEDLKLSLLRLHLFQKLGSKLATIPQLGIDFFTRGKLDKKKMYAFNDMGLDKQVLVTAMIDSLRRDLRKFALVKRDRLSIKEKLVELSKQLYPKEEYRFWNLIKDKSNILDVVITFISLLELARLKKVSLAQAQDGTDVYCEVLADLTSLDVEAANGFDEELNDPNSSNVKKDVNSAVGDELMITIENQEKKNEQLLH